MDTYMDYRFSAVGNTLLLYSGREEKLRIPERLGACRLERIGKSAFVRTDITDVTLPEGITEIASLAFSRCQKLRSATLPASLRRVNNNAFLFDRALKRIAFSRLSLPKHDFERLTFTPNAADGRRVTVEMPDAAPLQQMLVQGGIPKAAAFLPEELGYLFLGGDNADLFAPRPAFGTAEGLIEISEADSVRKLIAAGTETYLHSAGEAHHDLCLREHKEPEPEETSVLLFQGTAANAVQAELRIGKLFWPSPVPVISGGERCYVYRRCYLTANTALPYETEVVSVFNSHGNLLPDGERKEMIYGKYALARVL